MKSEKEDKNSALLKFAIEFAKYTASAERSNGLVSEIEKILNKKLTKEEELKLRLNIEIFITFTTIYYISCLSGGKRNQNKKKEFLNYYSEKTREIKLRFGNWPFERIEDYTNLLNMAGELYYKTLEGKIIKSEEDLNRLWEEFSDMVMLDLNFGPEINSKNKGQYISLLKTIKLELASLNYEVAKKLSENIGLFY